VAGFEVQQALQNNNPFTIAEIGGSLAGGGLAFKGAMRLPGYEPSVFGAATKSFAADMANYAGEKIHYGLEQLNYRTGAVAYAFPPEVWTQGHLRAAVKGFEGIGRTENGGPTFVGTSHLFPVAEGQLNRVNIKLTGNRDADFTLANAEAGISSLVPKGKNAPIDYVWHHVDDFNPKTGIASLELITIKAHQATLPHKGSAAQYRAHYGYGYE
jgi:hypothetical protein